VPSNLFGPGEDVPPEPVLRKVRIPFLQRATLVHEDERFEAFIVDLGLLGVFVERNEPLPTGDRVEIRFLLPGNAIPLVAVCRVAWWHPKEAPVALRVFPSGVGLEFTQMSEGDRTRIREHILTYCRRDSGTRRFVRHWQMDEEGVKK